MAHISNSPAALWRGKFFEDAASGICLSLRGNSITGISRH